MAPHEFKNLLDKYAQGRCTRQEEDFILEWYNKIGNDHQYELPEEYRIVIEAKLWSRIQDRMNKTKTRDIFEWKKMAAAIAIFLVAGAVTFALSSRFVDSSEGADSQVAVQGTDNLVTIRNIEQFAQVIKLRDGSEVTLEPQSEIQFPRAFGSEREVYLKGEAFFNVKRDPNHPFLVYSNEVVTRVLGTSFTVRAYADSKNITVAVKTGRVSVYKNGQQALDEDSQRAEVILTPNQQAIYDRSRNEVSRQLVSKPEIVHHGTKEPAMQYDGASVVKIFDELEEMYGVEIEFDSDVLENCTLTTSMKEEGLFERVKVICEAIGARYEVQDTSILIKSEGCIN